MARSRLQTLTEPMYYILLSLTEERYGYEIMQIITEKTKGRLKVGPGTLYTLLSRFTKEGFIEQVSEVDRRKTYIITDSGIELLKKEHERLKLLVQDGNTVLYGKRAEKEVDIKKDDSEEVVFKKPKDNSIFF